MSRRLSDGEHLLWQIDQAVPQNFVMAGRISGHPAHFKKILRDVLDILQQNQPSLLCRIKDGPPPLFETDVVPDIPLLVIPRRGDRHWISETEKELLLPMPWSTGPLIRATLLEGRDKCDVLITLCHNTADAVSGVKFYKQLLNLAADSIRGFTPLLDTLPELPSIEDLLKPGAKQKALALTAEELVPPSLHPVRFPGDREVPPSQRVTRVIQYVLPGHEVKKLMIKSRKEKASVHTALCAALMQTILRETREILGDSRKGPALMGCLTPVNIRTQLSQPIEDYMGNFISNTVHYQFIDDAVSIWEAARETKKALSKELEKGKDIRALLEAGKTLKPGEAPAEVLARLRDSFAPTAVANMGQWDIPGKSRELVLEELHYVPAMNPVVRDGFGLSVCGFHGNIILNFLYAEPFISAPRADRMAAETMKRLKMAIA